MIILRAASLIAIVSALHGTAHAADTATQERRDDSTFTSQYEEIVVTAGRERQLKSNVAQQMEVVSTAAMQRTPGSFVTDVLKKNASVDVIQYPGGTSGVGLRGFRPEFSGTSQRVLVLVDGRPAGVSHLGNLPQAGVERIEVLKGSASALYGSSAMGGVVNFLSRDSSAGIGGGADLKFGSFGRLEAGVDVGGAITPRLNFDFAFEERSQREDFDVGGQRRVFGSFVQGGSASRPFTSFETRSAFGRIGYELTDAWRLHARFHRFVGRDVLGPGAESGGQSNQSSNDADATALEVGISGELGAHRPTFLMFTTDESTDGFIGSDGRIDYMNGDRTAGFAGLQFRDVWQFADDYTLTFGADIEQVESESRRFLASGERVGPFSPDDRRETRGVYSELSARWLNERLLVNIGARYDDITNYAQRTPFRPDLTAGSSSFDTTNPRAGIVFFPSADRSFRIHASAGRAFVAPLVRQVAGHTEETAGSQRIVGRSNPGLRPETSKSYDLGFGYEALNWGMDLTWFRTDVQDKIESIIVINTPELRESTWINASSALAEGFEASVTTDLGAALGGTPQRWSLGSSATYYTDRRQMLPSGPELLRNVARLKINVFLSYDSERFGMRTGVRHVRGMIDRDFSRDRVFTDGQGGAFRYPNLLVWDLDLRWRIRTDHTLGVQVENLTDRYYYEKNDYPGAGRAVFGVYSLRF